MKTAQKRNRRLKSEKDPFPSEPGPDSSDPSKENTVNKQADPQTDISPLEKLSRAFMVFIEDFNLDKPPTKAHLAKIQKIEKRRLALEKKKHKGRHKIHRFSPPHEAHDLPSSIKIETDDRAYYGNEVNHYEPYTEPNYSTWNVPKLIQHLQFCYDNRLLTDDQIQNINEWMIRCAQEAEYTQEVAAPQPIDQLLENEVYMSNCMHIKICYFIWDRQNHGATDPTELGRKYKELYLTV